MYAMAPVSPVTMSIIKFWEVRVRRTQRTMCNTDATSQVNSGTLPTLFAMAMDYLPIQASAVPCERIFSSSAETDTKRRNRINPHLMETLQVLKFHLKKERLDFTRSWITTEKEMIDDDPDTDLLDTLLGENPQDGLDKVINQINQDED